VPVTLPGELVVLRAVVEQLRAGNGVSVASPHPELTTVEAAEMMSAGRGEWARPGWSARRGRGVRCVTSVEFLGDAAR
jgi:hypothetical protein